MRELRLRLPGPLDLPLTLGRVGRAPCVRLRGPSAWRATRTPDGPCCLALDVVDDEVRATAWGAGAAAALDGVPALLGFDDTPEQFRPGDAVLRELHRRRPGLRLGRTGAVVEALIPTVIGQRVTTTEAARSYRSLVYRFGEPAPGPAGLLLPPEPERLAQLPYWALHRCGIERGRAEVVRRVASRASRLERTSTLAIDEATSILTSIPGIGPWTAAKVALVALGDRDAVCVGDYNLPNLVSWALAGERRATDERMLELLAPYRPHRARAVRLLELSGRRPPRRAPRAALRSFATW